MRGASAEAGFSNPDTLATVTQVAVWGFTIVVAINQLGIATTLINTLLIGLVGGWRSPSGWPSDWEGATAPPRSWIGLAATWNGQAPGWSGRPIRRGARLRNGSGGLLSHLRPRRRRVPISGRPWAMAGSSGRSATGGGWSASIRIAGAAAVPIDPAALA